MTDERCPTCGRIETRDSATGTLFCSTCLLRLGLAERHGRVGDTGDNLLDHLRTLNVIGEGPRGRVFLAEWTTPGGGMAALKVASASAAAVRVEPRLTSLDHASIAAIHEIGTSDAIGSYAITDYVPGLPITRSSERQQLSSAERVERWLQAADAVAYAHARGLPHLNLKPTNVLVLGRMVKVLDFDRALPITAQIEGVYRAPEQVLPEEPDPRSDVYALGLLLGELLAGRPDAGLIEEVVRQATRHDPSERQPSVAALGSDVRAILHALSGRESA